MNVRMKKYEKKYQGPKKELEKRWKMKANLIPMITESLGIVTSKLEKWFQEQHQRSLYPEEHTIKKRY